MESRWQPIVKPRIWVAGTITARERFILEIVTTDVSKVQISGLPIPI
jgi:hypothetical protein